MEKEHVKHSYFSSSYLKLTIRSRWTEAGALDKLVAPVINVIIGHNKLQVPFALCFNT